MSAYSKCIAGFVGAFGPAIVAALSDGKVSQAELVQALIIGLVAAVTVYAAPKNADQ